MGERFVTPAGAVDVVETIDIVWLPASAPGGIVMVLPWSVTVPPCDETGWLTVAPLPTTGPLDVVGTVPLVHPQSGAHDRASIPNAHRFKNRICQPPLRLARARRNPRHQSGKVAPPVPDSRPTLQSAHGTGLCRKGRVLFASRSVAYFTATPHRARRSRTASYTPGHAKRAARLGTAACGASGVKSCVRADVEILDGARLTPRRFWTVQRGPLDPRIEGPRSFAGYAALRSAPRRS